MPPSKKKKKSKKEESSLPRKKNHPSKTKPPPQVVTCPTDFPTNRKRKQSTTTHYNTNVTRRVKPQKFLDWHETAVEVCNLGATAFQGQDKRNHQKESHHQLTGRLLKKQHVALSIRRGIQKKATIRQARLEQEAKQAGIVLPKTPKPTKRHHNNMSHIHGPAPSVGFMQKGILRVSKKK